MSANPWMKFYPRDWRGDQSLRAVSVAARGLWIECLCIMHEAKPYGHLVLNGQPVEDDTLARMTGVSVDEVSALIAELRQAGVLSVTSKGVIFSRRMTKDHARAGKGRKAVQKRWAQQSDNKEKSDEPNRSPIRLPTTQRPEARSQKVASQPRADDLLDRLLEAAGIRGNPSTGLAFPGEILGLIQAGYDLDRDILPAIRSRPNPRARSWAYFVPQIRDAAERKTAAASVAKPVGRETDWLGWCKSFFSSRSWNSSLGPNPEMPGCKAPPEIIEQARRAAERQTA